MGLFTTMVERHEWNTEWFTEKMVYTVAYAGDVSLHITGKKLMGTHL